MFISDEQDCIARIAASADAPPGVLRRIPTFPVLIPPRLNSKGKQTKTVGC